jgi:L-amino acid N-acyltransferase YncA
VAEIYLEGIRTGVATFETEAPSWEVWDAAHLREPRVAAREGGDLVGWAAAARVSRRSAYAGVAEHSVYVAERARGRGVGKALLGRFVEESEGVGIWTLQSSVFPENEASIALHLALGFRVVGRRERIARLGGIWRDTLFVERRSPKIQ